MPVLISPVVKGPAHDRPEILGTPSVRVQTAATKSKTLKFGKG